jgi:hypothetical protein
MTITEKILIALTLVSGVTFKLLGLLENSLTVTFMALTYFSLFALITNYIFRTGWSKYSLLLFFIQGGLLGLLFTIQHWPGQGPMRLLGHTALLVLAVLLIRYGIKKKADTLFVYATAVLLIGQVICALPMAYQLSHYGNLLFFPLVASIGTLKLNKLEMDFGMDKLLNIIFIQGLLYIMTASLQLLK